MTRTSLRKFNLNCVFFSAVCQNVLCMPSSDFSLQSLILPLLPDAIWQHRYLIHAHIVDRSKTHQRLKERFLIRRNRTKRANSRGNPLFQATYNTTQQKTVKPTYLSSVCCQEAGGRKRARDCLDEKRRRASRPLFQKLVS